MFSFGSAGMWTMFNSGFNKILMFGEIHFAYGTAVTINYCLQKSHKDSIDFNQFLLTLPYTYLRSCNI